MATPAHAVRSIDTPARHAEGVYLAAQRNTSVGGADEVSTSWKRSANNHGVNPDSSEAPRILMSHELKELREPLDQLILSAQEEIDRLYKVVREAGYTLLFCNTAGVAVEHRGDESDASRFKYWGTWLGGIWSEALEGTNGIGTCIAEERPVTVHRGQHYRSRHINLSCSGAPIFDVDGRLVAVLDVSAIDPDRSERAHALTGALTVASARTIEERFFREQFRRDWIVAIARAEDGAGSLLLAIDSSQRIIGADRAARTTLLLDDRRLQAGISLWSIFEQDRRLFRRRDTADIPTRLVIAGSDETWPALVTPPERASGAWQNTASIALHTRPRFDLLASTKQREPASQARRSATERHAACQRICRNPFERERRSRGAGRGCRIVGVSFRATVQTIGRCHAALLPRAEAGRARSGDAGSQRSFAGGDRARDGFFGPKPLCTPFPSDDRDHPGAVPLVAALTLVGHQWIVERLADPQQSWIIWIEADCKAEFPAQLQHRSVLGQHLADQFINPLMPRHLDQPRHQQVTQPAPFPVAAHGNGVFGGAVVRISGKTRNSERLLGMIGEGDQRHFAVIVDMR